MGHHGTATAPISYSAVTISINGGSPAPASISLYDVFLMKPVSKRASNTHYESQNAVGAMFSARVIVGSLGCKSYTLLVASIKSFNGW